MGVSLLRVYIRSELWHKKRKPASAHFYVAHPFVLAGLTYGGAWAIITSLGSSSILPLALGCIFASIAFVTAAYRPIGDELRETLRRLTFLKPAPASTSPLV